MKYNPRVYKDEAKVAEIRHMLTVWVNTFECRFGGSIAYCIAADMLDELIDSIKKDIAEKGKDNVSANKALGKSLFFRESLEKHRFDSNINDTMVEGLMYSAAMRCINGSVPVTTENVLNVISFQHVKTSFDICMSLDKKGVPEEESRNYVFEYMRYQPFLTKEMEEYIWGK